jgi:hypothetical protein
MNENYCEAAPINSALKRLAAALLGMDANAIDKLLADKELKEICKNEK